MGKLLIIVSLIAIMAQANELAKVRTEEDLRKLLLSNYDKNARPNYKTVVVFSSMTIVNFDVHEADHSMELQNWLSFSWKDPRLQWRLGANLNISTIGMDPENIWKPDLSVYNSAAGPRTLIRSQLPLLLDSTGKISYVPVYDFHFTCLMDLTYWPHDTHNCSVKIGSWVHNGHLLDLELKNFAIYNKVPTADTSDGQNLSRFEWNITETHAVREVKYYPCCEEPYVNICMWMLLTRNAPAYAWTVKMPAACLSILTLVMFLLPPGAGEKIIFGGLCLVLDLLYIDYTSYAINHAPSHTPLIVQLVCQQVVLLMISVIVSAIVIRISRDPHSSGIPSIIKRPVTTLAFFLCLRNYGSLLSRTIKPDEEEVADECFGDIRKRDLRSGSVEWLILAAVIDRLFFILYFAICMISLIRFSSVL
ncbi:neuronal acetylcholine receptor subunit alpha-7-like isoform X1 [Macrobrachium nipponense]|uniref:neuronal acetylcholine receptor subunit alpha-7-like isoform X1 n=3 Tax=Macrobrachium nipponense TaxID=159736 RepID=UPI0030C7DCEB